MAFKDHFSRASDRYQKFRPRYPAELFAFLAGLAPGRECAWDCATGNGQAAVALAKWFSRVTASDASQNQIAQARAHPRVAYRVATAEASGLEPAAIDLAVSAQAAHWFDHDAFFAEVRRVLKPRGVIALRCYALFQMEPEIDALVLELYRDVVGAFWPPERRHIEESYRSLSFPFPREAAPTLHMQAEWSLRHLVGYLGTWSAVHRYRESQGKDPIESIRSRLNQAWGDPDQTRTARWPLTLIIGRKQ